MAVRAAAERVRAATAVAPSALRIGGLTSLSATDYPGSLSAVVFCQGCPWRCRYCHNPHLLPARSATRIEWKDVVAFLERRVGLLDAVVFSGGEPLAQSALPSAMRAARDLGFRIGLHTGGAYPGRLADVLPIVDWVGFDVKASFGDYAQVTGARGSGDKALASARQVIASGVDHEFRTTVHPLQIGPAALTRLAECLASLGVRRYVVQEFRPDGCADSALRASPTPSFVTDAWCAAVSPAFESFAVRRA